MQFTSGLGVLLRVPWRGLEDLELATLEWVDWFNRRRLHHHNAGRVPPAEAEDLHYRQQHSGHQAETSSSYYLMTTRISSTPRSHDDG